jgi:hypothetical protein
MGTDAIPRRGTQAHVARQRGLYVVAVLNRGRCCVYMNRIEGARVLQLASFQKWRPKVDSHWISDVFFNELCSLSLEGLATFYKFLKISTVDYLPVKSLQQLGALAIMECQLSKPS